MGPLSSNYFDVPIIWLCKLRSIAHMGTVYYSATLAVAYTTFMVVVVNNCGIISVMEQKSVEQAAQELLRLAGGDVERATGVLMLVHNALEKPKNNTNENPVLVDISSVTKHYKRGSQKIEALKGVDVQIRTGEFVALTGTSGSGKSTLLQLIGGLDKPTNGTVTVDGHNISKLSDRKLSKFRNRTVGFVFQFFYLQPFLNVATNIEVPAMFARKKPKNRHNQGVSVTEAVGLSDRAKHLPRELSGGQMQRAAIARALMNSPKLLLADEPTGNLDSANASAIFNLFEELRTKYGTTIVVVTHDRTLASQADRTITLSDGAIA